MFNIPPRPDSVGNIRTRAHNYSLIDAETSVSCHKRLNISAPHSDALSRSPANSEHLFRVVRVCVCVSVRAHAPRFFSRVIFISIFFSGGTYLDFKHSPSCYWRSLLKRTAGSCYC